MSSTRLVVTESITVDGVIEIIGDWFDSGDDDQADLLAVTREQMAGQQSLLLGRETFESFRGYWPLQTDDTTGITEHLNRVSKYVITHEGMDDPAWGNSIVLTGDLVEEARRLKANGDGEIGVTGSISVVHELIDAGLVDEYRLFVYPAVVGRGRRLFREGVQPPRLKLDGAVSFDSGIVLMTYHSG